MHLSFCASFFVTPCHVVAVQPCMEWILIKKNLVAWKIRNSRSWYCKFKGCVCYIFASVFFKSKREYLWNKDKHFLFYFESFFLFWDNQILTFQVFRSHDVIKCLSMKHKTHFTKQPGKLIQSGNEIWSKRKFFVKEIYEKCCLETNSRLCSFQGMLCKKEPEEVSLLIWTNFDSFTNTYLIQVACFKTFIFLWW